MHRPSRLSRENSIPILVFSIHDRGALAAVLQGEGRATIIEEEPGLTVGLGYPPGLRSMSDMAETYNKDEMNRRMNGRSPP